MNKKILIVDDDDEFRKTIVMTLETLGYEVVGCSGGWSAFDMASVKQFDLVISDIRMPEGDGIELLLKLRNIDPEYPPVILMTGFTTESFQELLNKGALSILKKPFQIEELETNIEQVFSSMEMTKFIS